MFPTMREAKEMAVFASAQGYAKVLDYGENFARMNREEMAKKLELRRAKPVARNRAERRKLAHGAAVHR